MRFIDEAKIRVAAGHGGPGCVSFRRETFAPRGGPDGGDGGAGGDVIFKASKQLGTLQDFRFKRSYQAQAGMHGSGSNKAGRDGEDIEIQVPVGTIIKDAETGEVLKEFMEDGEAWIAAEGGRGGKGNAHFVSSTFQAPRFAQPGEDGTARDLTLELKLLADAAIIGFPNAGKSTLISRISAARPKIADYPFTTLVPNLGVVSTPSLESFVVADIPGLIEGAHQGMGLGHRFLKHIERTRVFVHLLDGTQLLEDVTKPDSDDPIKDAVKDAVQRYKGIRKELGLFNEELLSKPEIVVVNKVDVLTTSPELLDKLRIALRKEIAKAREEKPRPDEPFFVSAATGSGIDELLFVMNEVIKIHSPERAAQNVVVLPDDKAIRTD